MDFLRHAYSLKEGETPADFYDRWADTYDSEIAENGYATPRRCAEALAAAEVPRDGAVLDYGCGTGLSGVALRAEGFETIDGWDVSAQMLEAAAARGCYRETRLLDPADPMPTPDAPYAAAVAAGVIGPTVAPPETVDALMARLAPGGVLAFSLNDHALAEPAFEARVMEWVDCGAARLLACDYGDHLPGIDLGAKVYALRKR